MKVFISYSREDVEFVDRLSGSLVRRGFEPLVDRKDIQALDDWKKQLGRLIRQADAAIFVLSPAWLASEMCQWELQRVHRLGKRLAPIVKQDAGADVPSALSSLQYVFFTDPNGLEAQADALCNALQSDAAWSGAHTRYLDLAERWDELRRPDDHCLKGKELKDASQWLRKRPAVGAAPTDLQKQFIGRSKFINSWLYKTAQTMMTSAAASSDRLAGQIGNLLAEVFKYLFRFLLYLVAALFKAASYVFAWTIRHWKWAPATFAVIVVAFLYQSEISGFADSASRGFGLFATKPNPWDAIAAKYEPGKTFVGTVKRVSEQGIIVELEPGVEGLIPAAGSQASISERASIQVRVVRVDKTGRLIVLQLS